MFSFLDKSGSQSWGAEVSALSLVGGAAGVEQAVEMR